MRKNFAKATIGIVVGLILFSVFIFLFARRSGDPKAQSALIFCTLCCLTFPVVAWLGSWLDAKLGHLFFGWVEGARRRSLEKKG